MRPASDERRHKRRDGTSRRSFGNSADADPDEDLLLARFRCGSWRDFVVAVGAKFKVQGSIGARCRRQDGGRSGTLHLLLWAGGEGRWNNDPTISAGVVFVK